MVVINLLKKNILLDNLFVSTTNLDYIAADVTKPDQAAYLVREIYTRYGSLNTLICNVGSGKSVAPGSETYEAWLDIFHKNFFSATNVIESSVELMRKSINPSVLCISSICGLECIDGAPITYSVAKAALNAYIKFSSRHHATSGVRINGIVPGNLMIEGTCWDHKLTSNPESTLEYIRQNVPLNKFCDPEGLVELAIFLSSSLAVACTGSLYTIDAGQSRCL